MSAANSEYGSRAAENHTMSSSDLLNRRVKRMTIEVPHELHNKLKKAATDEDRYIRELVIDAVRDYLKRRHGI